MLTPIGFENPFRQLTLIFRITTLDGVRPVPAAITYNIQKLLIVNDYEKKRNEKLKLMQNEIIARTTRRNTTEL